MDSESASEVLELFKSLNPQAQKLFKNGLEEVKEEQDLRKIEEENIVKTFTEPLLKLFEGNGVEFRDLPEALGEEINKLKGKNFLVNSLILDPKAFPYHVQDHLVDKELEIPFDKQVENVMKENEVLKELLPLSERKNLTLDNVLEAIPKVVKGKMSYDQHFVYSGVARIFQLYQMENRPLENHPKLEGWWDLMLINPLVVDGFLDSFKIKRTEAHHKSTMGERAVIKKVDGILCLGDDLEVGLLECQVPNLTTHTDGDYVKLARMTRASIDAALRKGYVKALRAPFFAFSAQGYKIQLYFMSRLYNEGYVFFLVREFSIPLQFKRNSLRNILDLLAAILALKHMWLEVMKDFEELSSVSHIQLHRLLSATPQIRMENTPVLEKRAQRKRPLSPVTGSKRKNIVKRTKEEDETEAKEPKRLPTQKQPKRHKLPRKAKETPKKEPEVESEESEEFEEKEESDEFEHLLHDEERVMDPIISRFSCKSTIHNPLRGATVFLMEDKETGEEVVLKNLYFHRDPKGNELNIMRTIAAKEMPHLVHLKHGGYHYGTWNMILPKLQNVQFENRASSDIRKLFFQILIGLKSLHAEKIIHFDIKPKNIMMDHSGIQIIDFGCSLFEKDVTSDTFRGTEDYMAPEILYYRDRWVRGDYANVTTKCDIYSAGIVFGKMISHLIPKSFSWFSLSEVDQPRTIERLKDNLSSLSGDVHLMVDLFLKMTKRDPKERISAEEAIVRHEFFQSQRNSIK